VTTEELKAIQQAVNGYYNQNATYYIDKVDPLYYSGLIRLIKAKRAKLALPAFERVVDSGCAHAYLYGLIREIFEPEVVYSGHDPSYTLVQAAEFIIGGDEYAHVSQLELMEVSSNYGELGVRSWLVLALCSVLTHIPKTEHPRVLAKLLEISGEIGWTVISVVKSRGKEDEQLEDGRYFARYEKPDIEALISEAGRRFELMNEDDLFLTYLIYES